MKPSKLDPVARPDGLPRLTEQEVQSALAWLRTPQMAPGVSALFALFRVWRLASPFHNLDLLAGLVDRPPPLTAHDAVARALLGLGGPCHVQATGFASLLVALGYDAALMPATITVPDDHLLVGVEVEGQRFFCDVGNGHPYPEPFFAGEPTVSESFGWTFRTTPVDCGISLDLSTPDGDLRHVYTARWEPRDYKHFAANIVAHHTQPGFGPFMTGLRAVRITPRGMLSLRDARFERHTPFGIVSRPVLDLDAARRLLAGPFGLEGAPIDDALRALSIRRPELFPRVPDTSKCSVLGERLWCLVACATTDRPASLQRMLLSLASALRMPGELGDLRGRVAVLVVENSVDAGHRARNLEMVELVVRDGLRVSLVDDHRYGRSIAESRIVQTEQIARHTAEGNRPAMVWMTDDDTAFATLELVDGVLFERPNRSVFEQILRWRAQHPEVSAVVGTVQGDPHVRPEAIIRTQTFDLVENLARIGAQRSDAQYRTPDAAELLAMKDYYYDHSRAGTEHLHQVCPWLPREHAGTVRDELVAYLDAALGIASGRAATRPLLSARNAPNGLVPCTAPLRGGNVVFFDLDACFAHPYPTAKLGAVETRRADMIGCTLLARSRTHIVATGPLTLLHERPAGPSAAGTTGTHWASLRSEFHGVLLARLAMDGCPDGAPPETHLRGLAEARADTIVEALVATQRQLTHLDETVMSSRAWWQDDPEIRARLDSLRRTLRETWNAVVPGNDGDLPTARLALLRQALVDPSDLEAVLQAWRGLPGAISTTFAQMERVFREACG